MLLILFWCWWKLVTPLLFKKSCCHCWMLFLFNEERSTDCCLLWFPVAATPAHEQWQTNICGVFVGICCWFWCCWWCCWFCCCFFFFLLFLFPDALKFNGLNFCCTIAYWFSRFEQMMLLLVLLFSWSFNRTSCWKNRRLICVAFFFCFLILNLEDIIGFVVWFLTLKWLGRQSIYY